MPKPSVVYRVTFVNDGKVYEIYARSLYQADLFGFIEVKDFLFGEKSELLIDPNEEKLKTEFSGVEKSYIPLHSVIRIDVVKKQGKAKLIPLPTKKEEGIKAPIYVKTPSQD